MANETVLIVEDDNELREALETALSAESLRVLTAADGVEGVQIALEHHPDLILMDIMMPNLNGHEATNRIRNDRWGKDVKIVFLTALSDAENVVYAVESGSEEYIVKSHTSLGEIVGKVKEVIHGYKV